MSRLLLSTRSYFPQSGGVATYVDKIAKGMRRRGWDVRIFHVDKGVVPILGENSLDETMMASHSLADSIGWADIVHMNGFTLKVALETRKLGRPLVWTHHEYDTSCPIGVGWNDGHSCEFQLAQCTRCMINLSRAKEVPRRFGMLPLRQWVATQASLNIMPSQFLSSRLRLPRTSVVPHGVEGWASDSLSFQRPPRFVFLGRLVSLKGADVFIDAVRICRGLGHDFHIDFIGDGPLLSALKDQASEARVSDRIHFLGTLPHAESMNLLRESEYCALVVPSVWDEVFGFVAIEGMATGIPVIASNVGGLAEVVDSTGMLFDRRSSYQLACAMVDLASNERLWLNIRQAGLKAHAEKYSLGEMIDRHVQCYKTAAIPHHALPQ